MFGASGQAVARYVLESAKGRLVTNDSETGLYLTGNPALAYTWSRQADADSQRGANEQAINVAPQLMELKL